jgi:hypothetical protein
MEGSASGASPDEGSGGSPLAALSTAAGKVRAAATERLGADARERTRGPAGGRGDAGAAVPAPPFEERPELYVGAAFAGGVVLAGLLRLLGR